MEKEETVVLPSSFVCEEDVVVALATFIKHHSWLINRKAVNFLISNYWDEVPIQWRDTLERLSFEEIRTFPLLIPKEEWPETLKSFMLSCRALSLPRVSNVKEPTEKMCHSLRAFMTPKKQHEVSRMVELVHQMALAHSCKTILDLGSGEGYLSRVLSYEKDYNVLAVDASNMHTEGAKRKTKFVEYGVNKHKTSHGKLYHLDLFVHQSMDFDPILKTMNIPDTEISRLALIGLHCCGDLTPSMMKLFLSCEKIKTLACVGCCYQRLSLDSTGNWQPLSNTVKQLDIKLSEQGLRLACDSVQAWVTTDLQYQEKCLKTSFWRMLLQVFLKEANSNCKCRFYVPRKTKSKSDFPSYATYALNRLRTVKDNLCQCENHKTTMSDIEINQLETRFANGYIKMLGYLAVRTSIAPVLESLVLLDRFLFLKENNVHVKMFPLFEEALSPRNMVFLCNKN